MTDTLAPASTQMHTREFHVREFNAETREFVGVAVPWDTPAEIRDWFGSYTETFTRGSVTVPDGGKVLLYWRHSEPIGLLSSHEDTDEGWEIRGRISDTPRGNEAYTLLRDGVVDELSIGFLPVRHEIDDATGDVTRTEVVAREVSLVPFGAYGSNAKVSEVRADHKAGVTSERSGKEHSMNTTEGDLEVRAELEELQRSFADFVARSREKDEPVRDTRSPGEILKALVRGDEDTTRRYNDLMERAYTGGTTADSILLDQWVGDLTRIVDEANTLRSVFSTGVLPATGNVIEYGVLDTNTMTVTEQAAEGDDLAYGEIKLTTKTAPVKTFGGYTQLSRQQIERSSVAFLDHALRALAIAANKRRNISFRSFYAAAVSAAVVAENTVEVQTLDAYTDWVGAIVDAAESFEDNGLALDALLVDKSYFKELAGLAGEDGRPLMTVFGSGANVVGEIDPKALRGNLAGVTVVLNPKQAAPGAAFVNHLAIRDYTSPVTRLQDENIVNLSKDFSLYYYSALALEIPEGIVPVEVTGS